MHPGILLNVQKTDVKELNRVHKHFSLIASMRSLFTEFQFMCLYYRQKLFLTVTCLV